MGHYPFTLFNGVTSLVLSLTLLIWWGRFRGRLAANWPLACYALIVGHTLAFSGGLNPFWVAAGVLCALAIRLGFYARQVRWFEMIPLAYIAYRCVGLVLMW